MIELGLQPSHTGLPEGRVTGRKMSHYIVPGGRFLKAANELLLEGFHLPWMDRHAPIAAKRAAERQEALTEAGITLDLTPKPTSVIPDRIGEEPTIFDPRPPRPRNRIKYSCTKCETRAWAPFDTEILCGACNEQLICE